MTNNRPPSNRNGNGPRKPNYGSVPVRSKQNVQRKSGGSKYNMPKKNKLPTPVIVTNILMICVILAVCGVVFAIAFNNIQYDKADASRNSRRVAAAVSSVSSENTQSSKSSVNSNSAAVSSAAQSSVATSSAAEESTAGNNTSATVPTGEFNAEFFKNDLFIGDSIFTGLYGYSYLDRENVAAAIGYTPYGAQETDFDESFFSGSAVDYAKSRQPKRIIIMLGSNSLSPQTDFDDFRTGYRGLLNKLKANCPDSVICAVSVPPITADSSLASYSGITNSIINKANENIKSLCGELGVMYYDFNSVLKDENGYFKEEYAEVDGMHFMGSTYPIFLSGIEKFFEQQ